jgi:magnesium chelatase accessory protein
MTLPDAPPPWWPHAARSRYLDAAGLRWHVQRWPHGRADAPVALLLHGTGAATHSWRHLAPLLAPEFDVIAPDLPGHAFTRTPPSQALSLPAVARALAALLDTMQARPTLVVGHSAGAAIALRLVLDGLIDPALTVSINGAILPLQGPVGRWFQPLARLLVVNPLVPPAFALWARLPVVAQRLIDSTGSRIDAEGQRCYAQLLSDAAHAAGALRLMASWDLQPLADELHGWRAPLLLLAAEGDRTLPPAHSQHVRRHIGAAASFTLLPGLGHLAHEEDARAVLAPLASAWRDAAQVG